MSPAFRRSTPSLAGFICLRQMTDYVRQTVAELKRLMLADEGVRQNL